MISVPTVKESDLFVILPVKKHREAIGAVSGEDRSGICSVSCGGIVTIIIVVYIVVHRGGDRSNIDTVIVSVPRAQNIQLFLFI